MKKRVVYLFMSLLGSMLFLSCNSSSEDSPVDITIPEVDEECCNAEETFLTYTFLNNGYVKEIPELRDTIDGKYALSAYSANGKLHIGYNDIFFALVKISTQGYVRDFNVTDISPLMTMSAMNMKHSTPTATETVVYDETFPAVRRAWVSFLMKSEGNDFWELTYKASFKNASVQHASTVINVNGLNEGITWLKSFKYNDATYYLSIVNPNQYQTGVNTIKAYVSKQNADRTQPYPLATETFTIDIYPPCPTWVTTHHPTTSHSSCRKTAATRVS